MTSSWSWSREVYPQPLATGLLHPTTMISPGSFSSHPFIIQSGPPGYKVQLEKATLTLLSPKHACPLVTYFPGTALGRDSSQSHKGKTWPQQEEIRYIPALPLLTCCSPHSSHNPQGWQRQLLSTFYFGIAP